MTTLITILYAFLFSTPETVMPDCQGRLEELNYTYEYNKEPALEHLGKGRGSNRYSTRIINVNDSIPISVKTEINTMYNCFKSALEADTNQVLLISFYPFFSKDILDKNTIKYIDFCKECYFARRIRLLLSYHELYNHSIYYYTSTQQENPTSRYKIELLHKSNPRLKNKDMINRGKCKNCPF